MGMLKDLIVTGSSRLLGKLYCGDINISGTATFTDSATIPTLTASTHLTVGSYVNNSYTLSTSTAIVNDWIRTVGSTGWYNQSYGGGWYMTNGNFVQPYNKPVLMSQNLYFGTTPGTAAASQAYYITTGGAAKLASANIPTLVTGSIENSGQIFTDAIRSNKWEIQTIQNMGGNFYVAPTIQFTEGCTVACTAVTSTTITVAVIDGTNITSNSFAGHTWTANSKVKVSGGIGTVILGTCEGVLTANMNTSSGRLQMTITTDQASKFTANTNYTAKNLSAMMYNIGGNYPVGILMTSYGTNKYSYIDLYSGSTTIPTTRIGKLDGLKDASGADLKINGANATGYGIYTNNGYFAGTIVSTSGTIGGFTIGATSIRNTKTSYNETTNDGVWVGTDGIGLGKGTFYVTNAGSVTAKSGTVGGINMKDDCLFSQNTSTNPAKSGDATRYIAAMGKNGNTWMSGYAFSIWKAEWDASSSSVKSGYPFYVSYAGKLYANNAEITGSITASSGTIGGYTIGTSTMYSNGHTAYNTAKDGVYMGTDYIALGNGGKVWFKNDGTFSLGSGNAKISYNGSAITFGSDVKLAWSQVTGTGSIATTDQIPTNISDLTNDSGFQTSSQVESAITGKGYQTSSQVESAITGKGYQTSSQVESAITGKGYQTATQVTTITNNAISTASLAASQITSGTISADRIGANSITTAKLATDAIKSTNYSAPTTGTGGTTPYSAAGTYLNLSDGSITSKNFIIAADGTAKFKGDITGATGTFAGSISASEINITSRNNSLANRPGATSQMIFYGAAARDTLGLNTIISEQSYISTLYDDSSVTRRGYLNLDSSMAYISRTNVDKTNHSQFDGKVVISDFDDSVVIESSFFDDGDTLDVSDVTVNRDGIELKTLSYSFMTKTDGIYVNDHSSAIGTTITKALGSDSTTGTSWATKVTLGASDGLTAGTWVVTGLLRCSTTLSAATSARIYLGKSSSGTAIYGSSYGASGQYVSVSFTDFYTVAEGESIYLRAIGSREFNISGTYTLIRAIRIL